MMPIRGVRWLTALLVAASCGCSFKEPTYPVSGKVVYKDDGSPAASGVYVMFESTKEPYARAMGKIETDGTFKLATDRPDNGAMQGEHRVCIQPMAADGSGADLTPQMAKKIDRRFFELRTSGIKFDIQTSGKNEFVVEVERPKG